MDTPDNAIPHIRWLKEYCYTCGKQLNSWDVRCSKALGYQKYHCCEHCIAKEYDESVDRLRDTLEEYFGLRPCRGL